jgi:TetR/AcrR family transcriptional regulator, regulator of cefoperazone and chloramphenicol sensitivity
MRQRSRSQTTERGRGRRARASRSTNRDTARGRILETSKQLFAQYGFDGVTVRDICREAGANLALVNYHFGDKLGLYLEVVNDAIVKISAFNSLTMDAPEGSSAEQRLEHFVRTLLRLVFEERAAKESWIHKLMQHEISRPTAAAERILQVAIAPRVRYLSSVVAELLDCPVKDPRVVQCVSSVHGLCVIYLRYVQLPDAFRQMLPEQMVPQPMDAQAAADHVLAFSMAGIREIKRRKTRRGKPPA